MLAFQGVTTLPVDVGRFVVNGAKFLFSFQALPGGRLLPVPVLAALSGMFGEQPGRNPGDNDFTTRHLSGRSVRVGAVHRGSSPGGAGTERSETGLNWRIQAPSPADVSLEAASGDLSAFADSGELTGQIRQLAPAFARHLARRLSGGESVSPASYLGRTRCEAGQSKTRSNWKPLFGNHKTLFVIFLLPNDGGSFMMGPLLRA